MKEINYMKRYGDKRFIKGFIQGFIEEMMRERIDIAKTLLQNNFTKREVSDITRLPLKKVEELEVSLSTCEN